MATKRVVRTAGAAWSAKGKVSRYEGWGTIVRALDLDGNWAVVVVFARSRVGAYRSAERLFPHVPLDRNKFTRCVVTKPKGE